MRLQPQISTISYGYAFPLIKDIIYDSKMLVIRVTGYYTNSSVKLLVTSVNSYNNSW
jgi:hypothetical protein